METSNNAYIGRLEMERRTLSKQIHTLEREKFHIKTEVELYANVNNEEMVGTLSQQVYKIDEQIDALYDQMLELKYKIGAVR